MKRFLVTDNRGQMEIFNRAELELLSVFKFDDGLTVEDYLEETEAIAEKRAAEFDDRQLVPLELEMLDLYRERVPF